MLEIEALIVEFRAENRVTTIAVSKIKVSTLGHEAGNYSVEKAAFVAKPWVVISCVSSCELSEVICSFGHFVTEHAKDDTSSSLSIDCHVKEDLMGDFSESICEG